MYHHSRHHKRSRNNLVRTAPTVAVTATSEPGKRYQEIRIHKAYTDALLGAGLIPLVVPPMPAAQARALLDSVDGLVLTGGEDVDPEYFREPRHPATGSPHALRDECELALARAAFERRMPTLAICRGIQVLNVAMGGSLVQDIPAQVPGAIRHSAEAARSERVHGVKVAAGSRLGGIVGSTAIATNSFHHQSVARLASGLSTSATSEDGVVEAVESTDPGWWAVGVQWHPEELVGTPDDWDRRLFAAFAEAIMSSRA
jgi:putative glutamine amidotransferase